MPQPCVCEGFSGDTGQEVERTDDRSVVNLADGERSLVPSRCPKIKHKVSDTFALVCRGGSLGF